MVARIIPVDPFDLVIFGASGDLAQRKILPSLYHRMIAGQMPREARIFGAARSKMSRSEFQDYVADALRKFAPESAKDEESLKAFLDCLDYVAIDATGEGGWSDLKAKIEDGANPVRAFYMSVAPSLFGAISERLSQTGIATEDSRIVVEKPLGHDLESARALNAQLSASFDESQIYRIDHYLGKETVQNLMALRFANALFEPLWNAQHIDHVQITVAESIGVAGRGGYYDKSGAMRDMVQNHIMQLLCLTAMEPPSRFDPDSVRDEKLKVIRALDPVELKDTVRGQYRAGNGEASYKEHAENPDSKTESFVALKVGISNWRWTGTPFYLRTGKRLRARMSEIEVQFKEPPHNIFRGSERVPGNALVIRLQPNEGITMLMTIKEPGQGGMRLRRVPLDMSFAQTLDIDTSEMADAYERLIMDVIRGDQTLFMRGDEVEAAWAWTDPILQAWAESSASPEPYDAGGSGPDGALALMHMDGRKWREIEA
ncbi:glucose-6-phosphate dehydrogenase [Oceanomicrobium pacificus]|uniref:Glucose-6-phosphate 1-dehydrogenase n=1 Tax=Oceanomicrobium pacificus TaxID=2692916 RepID=A0A6B0TQV6_9RHOB|nr:glucose-6-phosphate dehydrogenase [Oceanomicrobium pacificus]MXU64175.1 glucose-6-phosphate dehydrogenase [Oceanomicrobium pacificus]